MWLQSVYLLLLLIVHLFVATQAQYGQNLPNSQQHTFYMNKLSDCDGKPRNVGQATVYIFGVTSEPQSRGALSCTLTLDSDNRIEPNKFKIQFLSVDIRNPTVHFYIYDGEFNGRKLHGFSSTEKLPQGLDFDFTTGQRVTFRLTKGELDRDYDIRLIVTPVPRDIQKCTYENEYGCGEYGFSYRPLGTKEIAAIIAGGFAFVVIIVVIVVVCCYRKQRGISRRWKEEKLGATNTAASIHSLSGKVIKDAPSTKPWTSESSKAEFASIRRSPKLPRVSVTRHAHTADRDRDRDKDSAFGSSESLHRQRAPLSARGHSMPRNTRRDHRDYREKDYRRRDRDYDRDSDRSHDSDRHYKPPTYREALRHDQSRSESELGDATEHSFVQADDDHPQKTFVERVIEPRVKPKKQASPLQQKRVIPPPELDLTYDSIEPKKTTINATKSKAVEVEKEEDSETEESDTSNTDNESEESEEESAESEDEQEPKKVDKPDAADVYSKVNKNKENQAKESQPYQNQGFMPPQQRFMQPPQNMQGLPYPGYFPPGVHQPQPRYGYPMQPAPPYQGQLPRQGQGMQPQVQVPQPNAYDQANFTVPMNQPGPQFQGQGPPMMQYNNGSAQPQQPQQSRRHGKPSLSQQPNNPPIYSYLVNRGYQPLDGRQSPVSTATGGSNISGDRNLQVEDSDFSANLDSGVELLKRK